MHGSALSPWLTDADAASSRAYLRRKSVQFNEADSDGNDLISYDEFHAFVMPRFSEDTADCKRWWELMDANADGAISKDEFFVYALCAAIRRAGTNGILSIFRRFDADSNGSFGLIEFERALDEMGFGDAAAAIFASHAESSLISYLALLKFADMRMSQPSMRAFVTALAADGMLKVDSTGWIFGGKDAKRVREELCRLLHIHRVKLSKLFEKMDDDSSFFLTPKEFTKAFNELGYNGMPETIDEIFHIIDQDSSGQVGFDELSAWVHGRKIVAGPRNVEKAAKLSLTSRLQASFDAGDDGWTDKRLQSELRSLLAEEGLRAIDLLKAWDKYNEAGSKEADDKISQKEYLVAMKTLCGGAGDLWYMMARSAAIDAFHRIDRTADKSISAYELCHWIDPHGRLLAAGRTKKTASTEIKHERAKTDRVLQASGDAVTDHDAQLCIDEESIPAETGIDPKTVRDDGTAYSPTKFATRLAQIRAFDPDVIRAKATSSRRACMDGKRERAEAKGLGAEAKRRAPLWEPRNALLPISPRVPPPSAHLVPVHASSHMTLHLTSQRPNTTPHSFDTSRYVSLPISNPSTQPGVPVSHTCAPALPRPLPSSLHSSLPRSMPSSVHTTPPSTPRATSAPSSARRASTQATPRASRPSWQTAWRMPSVRHPVRSVPIATIPMASLAPYAACRPTPNPRPRPKPKPALVPKPTQS